MLVCGHWYSSFCKNYGQFHQIKFDCSWSTFLPLDSKSAGLTFVGTCRHCLGFDDLYISPIRLATKGLKSRLLPLTQCTTFILSDQNTKCSSDTSNACRTESANRNPNAAAINSSLGMLIDVNGATLDFAAINRTDTNPFLYRCLAYTTDP
jgi:hypothetical protein